MLDSEALKLIGGVIVVPNAIVSSQIHTVTTGALFTRRPTLTQAIVMISLHDSHLLPTVQTRNLNCIVRSFLLIKKAHC